jgi:hypothetical protein
VCGEKVLREGSAVRLSVRALVTGTNMPGQRDGRHNEGDETEDRDGKQDLHAPQEGYQGAGLRAAYSAGACGFEWPEQIFCTPEVWNMGCYVVFVSTK